MRNSVLILIIHLFLFAAMSMRATPDIPSLPSDLTKPTSEYKLLYERALLELEELNSSLSDIDQNIHLVDQKIITVEDELIVSKDTDSTLLLELAGYDQQTAKLNEVVQGVKIEHQNVISNNQRLQNDLVTLFSRSELLLAEISQLESDFETKSNLVRQLEFKLSVPHIPGWHYQNNLGWIWTTLDVYPYIYSVDRDNWLHYQQGSHEPWLYYDFHQGAWQKWLFN